MDDFIAPDAPPAPLVPAVDRAARLLAILESSTAPVGISEAARLLDASKSSVRDVLETLRHHQLIERDQATKRYRLGDRLIHLGQAAQAGRDLPDRARPVLAELARLTSHSSLLLVRGQEVATFVQKADPPSEAVRLAIPLGWRIPYLAGACGKVFLAFASAPERQQALANLPRFTDRTITRPASYEAEIEATRMHGYATDDQEYMDGVRAVAAPVFGQDGSLAGVILVVGLCIRFQAADLPDHGEIAARLAAGLSASMAGRRR